MMNRYYYAELEPDARGFRTFLEVEVIDNKIVNVTLDAKNEEDNPYGLYKTTSSKYNEEMYAESGTRYADAVENLENQIIQGKTTLDRVKGARFLSQDANELLSKIRKMIEEDEQLSN